MWKQKNPVFSSSIVIIENSPPLDAISRKMTEKGEKHKENIETKGEK